MKLIHGKTAFMKQVRQIVAPTPSYQLMPKSRYLPAKIGKFSGKGTTSLQSALISSRITAVEINWTTHIFVVVLLSLCVASCFASYLLTALMNIFSKIWINDIAIDTAVKIVLVNVCSLSQSAHGVFPSSKVIVATETPVVLNS